MVFLRLKDAEVRWSRYTILADVFRASRKYTEVSTIVVTDANNMQIHYQGGQPDYITAKADDIKEMLHIFRAKTEAMIDDKRSPDQIF